MDLFPIEEKIFESLKKVTQENWHKDLTTAEWTALIKNTLAKLGKSRGFYVYASGLTEKVEWSEWLWDLTWAFGTPKTWQFHLSLACEIEWSGYPEDVVFDFQKLTVALADFRLLVFGHFSDENTQKIINLCRDTCPGSRGFRYLLIGIPEFEPIRFRKEAWTL